MFNSENGWNYAFGGKTIQSSLHESKFTSFTLSFFFFHLTGVITVSASGKCFNPMLILPSKKIINGLEEFDCFFTSSPSGWMTKRLLLIYTISIISQIQIYRLFLPPYLSNQPILLIADSHSSRLSFYANLLFLKIS